jgi:hypothetical protein
MNFDLTKMQFSVIYSFDIQKNAKMSDYLPSEMSLFEQTEDDDSYEMGYLEGDWEGGHHRKLAALLDLPQFEKFLEDTELVADSVETMGSIGAPGFGFGWAPAISFDNRDPEDGFSNAYVTPVPTEIPPDNDEEMSRVWEELKSLIVERYGKG